jgi:polypyrimidine tract-binding protein 1
MFSGTGVSDFGQDGPHLGGDGSSVRGQPAHMASAFNDAMPRTPLGLSRIQNLNGPVLLVSKIDEIFLNCDDLFVLFGVYGDVQRVKIMLNKKGTALVQMSEPQQALLAMKHLDKTKLWGQQIRVISSEHTTVRLLKDCQPDDGSIKDYGNSNLHRFKKVDSKNHSNIYPPSTTLHLSNIPTTIEESVLREVFGNIGLHVQKFKFFQDRRMKITPTPQSSKMAQVRLANLDEAIYALVKLHNYQLSKTSYLMVNFSISTL